MNSEIRKSFATIGFTLATVFGLIVGTGLIAGFNTHDNLFYYAVGGLCLGLLLIAIPLVTPVNQEEPDKERDALR